MKGLIALDIDGTLTHHFHHVSPEVVNYLDKLSDRDWIISLITGRSMSFASTILRAFEFPYCVALQNGALIVQMPEKSTLAKHFLDRTILPVMSQLCQRAETDFILYTGPENGDRCYYRPHLFDHTMRSYLEHRSFDFQENWCPVQDWDSVPTDEFTSIKCFGEWDVLQGLAEEMEKKISLNVPIIRDPYSKRVYLMQATHHNAHKGRAVQILKTLLKIQGPIIAAGDDLNDMPMLEAADIKIAMAEAPVRLREMATIVAASVKEDGIIGALEKATNWERS